jgi:hypothetical protein
MNKKRTKAVNFIKDALDKGDGGPHSIMAIPFIITLNMPKNGIQAPPRTI